MAAVIRTFLGISIPATPALDGVLREIGSLGRGVRVTRPDHLHLTLKFLGETRREALPGIRRCLTQAALSASVLEIRFVSLGAFPRFDQPRVVWAGVQPAGELQALSAALDSGLEPLGFVPEDRAFHPHLTLARVGGSVVGLTDFLQAHEASNFGSVLVDRLELFQSEPTPQGSRYTSLATGMLQGH